MEARSERTSALGSPQAPTEPTVPGAAIGPGQRAMGSPVNLGIVPDFVWDFRDDLGRSDFGLREVELNFGGAIDPYFEAVLTVSYADDDGFDMEEAYISSTYFPGELLGMNLMAQAGREFIPFGYLNRIHLHDFPQVDPPFVIEELTTDHGFIGNGAHLEWLAPLFNPTFSVSAGFYDSIEHSVGRRIEGRPAVLRLQSYWESQDGNHGFLAGVSGLSGIGRTDGRRPETDYRTVGQTRHVIGADLRYRWSPTGEKRGLISGTEFLRQAAKIHRRADADDLRDYQEDFSDGDRIRDLGFYAYSQYDFNPFYSAGYRFDYTDLLLSDGDADLYGHSLYGEYRPSEFSRLRLQYQFRDGDNFIRSDRMASNEHRVLLQATFFLGWHPPHVF